MYYGKKVILRGMELSDVDDILKGWNSLELRRTLMSQLPNSHEDEVEFVKSSWENRRKGTGYQFLITTMEGKFLGTIGLFSIDNINRSAELGIAIHDPNTRGKGYGTDAVRILCAVGFKILNLHRIYLHYVDFNEANKVYQNAGFTGVGKQREAIWTLGEYHDVFMMDILAHEFNEKFPDYTLFKS